MGKIIRREFVGSRLLLLLLCLPGITLPFAIVYLLEATVTIENEIEDPEAFMKALRAGRLDGK